MACVARLEGRGWGRRPVTAVPHCPLPPQSPSLPTCPWQGQLAGGGVFQKPKGRGHGQQGQRGTGVPRSGAGEALCKEAAATWGCPDSVPNPTIPHSRMRYPTIPGLCLFLYM